MIGHHATCQGCMAVRTLNFSTPVLELVNFFMKNYQHQESLSPCGVGLLGIDGDMYSALCVSSLLFVR